LFPISEKIAMACTKSHEIKNIRENKLSIEAKVPETFLDKKNPIECDKYNSYICMGIEYANVIAATKLRV
jgi:hypothetical protein